MNRLPLADQLPYSFLEPKVGRFWLALGRLYARRVYLREHRVHSVEVRGLDRLKALLDRGDGILIAPNHPDHADCGVMLDLGRQLDRAIYFMAAYQLFRGHGGLARFMLPRIGAFPVDREGSDLKAFKTGVEILARGRDPLVVFPEGEIYHLAGRLTPLRDGAVALATTAAKRLASRGKSTWIVPTALQYRFVSGQDPLPALGRVLDGLEARFSWGPRPGRPIVERVYQYAAGLLALKELEYLGETRSGPIPARVASLRDAILDGLESRLGLTAAPGSVADEVPLRVKAIRRACLDRLAEPGITASSADELRRVLQDVFVAVQLFSYPGDYLRERPTVERLAETLTKFEQDTLGTEPPPRADRHAIVEFGEPIDIGARLATLGKPRVAIGAITAELHGRIQAMIDALGSGRPIDPELVVSP